MHTLPDAGRRREDIVTVRGLRPLSARPGAPDHAPGSYPTGAVCSGRPVLVAACLLALPACMPVSSVVGRSAAVLPEGVTCESLGGGGFYVWGEQWEESAGTESLQERDLGTASLHFAYTKGLGRRADVQVGGTIPFTLYISPREHEEDEEEWLDEEEEEEDEDETTLVLPVPIGIELFGVLRYQVVGSPFDPGLWPPDMSAFPLDMSVEIGGAAGAAQADCHAGVNVSLRGGRINPYVSYRYHLGTARRDDVTAAFRHHMVYVGIEGPAGGEGNGPGTLAIELFYGWAPYDEPSPDRSAWKTGGINIIVRSATF